MKKKLLLLLAWISFNSFAQTIPVIPNEQYQTIEGWGTSLCWWANNIGDWDEAKLNEILYKLSDPTQLNFNIFRYNIGGGDAPGHTHQGDRGIPSFKDCESCGYDWNADPYQRRVLLKLKALRNDAIFEAFANSPPWWMTYSGCSSGSDDGNNNCRNEYYDDWAEYLTDVVKWYRDEHGLVFRTIAPFNEPDGTWWGAWGSQEGCRVTWDHEFDMVNQVYERINSKGLNGTSISSNDANTIDHALEEFNAMFVPWGAINKVSQINTHTYGGTRRAELRDLAQTHGKRLWQSESGPIGISGNDEYDIFLGLAQRIVTDLRDLRPVAWLDWQFIDHAYGWGLMWADYSNENYGLKKSFYTRMQFSRFIKAGYKIIGNSQWNSVAALSPSGKEVVVVVVNQNNEDAEYKVDLTRFQNVANNAQVYRTTASEDCEPSNITISNKIINYTIPARSVVTFIVPVSGISTGGIISGATYKILARHSGQALEVADGSQTNAANVRQGVYTGEASQHWTVTNVDQGIYKITATHSGQALDVSAWSTEDGGDIIQWPYGGGANQLWKINNIEGNFYSILNNYSGKAVDVAGVSQSDGADVIQWTFTGGYNQQWDFIQIEDPSLRKSIEKDHSFAFPNPFEKSTKISLSMEEKGDVKIDIFNSRGKRIQTLNFNDIPSGINYLKWDGLTSNGNPTNPGLYIYKIKTKNKLITGKVFKE